MLRYSANRNPRLSNRSTLLINGPDQRGRYRLTFTSHSIASARCRSSSLQLGFYPRYSACRIRAQTLVHKRSRSVNEASIYRCVVHRLSGTWNVAGSSLRCSCLPRLPPRVEAPRLLSPYHPSRQFLRSKPRLLQDHAPKHCATHHSCAGSGSIVSGFTGTCTSSLCGEVMRVTRMRGNASMNDM